VKFACIVDAFYTLNFSRYPYLLSALFVSIWVSIKSDNEYMGPAPRVKSISSMEEFRAVIQSRSLICFSDSRLNACKEYAIVHKELSVSTDSSKFGLVEVDQNDDICKHAKVYLGNQPVLVLFENGKETARLPADSNKPKQYSEKRYESLQRAFWYQSVRKRFRL
jgi:hypothetical protein